MALLPNAIGISTGIYIILISLICSQKQLLQVEMDFKVAFQNEDNFLNEWDQSAKKIISFLSKENRVKDKTCRALIENLKNNTTLGESKYLFNLFNLFVFVQKYSVKSSMRLITNYSRWLECGYNLGPAGLLRTHQENCQKRCSFWKKKRNQIYNKRLPRVSHFCWQESTGNRGKNSTQ